MFIDHRSAQQVSDRLDGLIQKIYDIQRPCMNDEAPADVVLVSPESQSFTSPH